MWNVLTIARVALVGAVWLAAAAVAEKLPVETFARNFAFESVKLSPDGQWLAYSYLYDGIPNLAVLDLQTRKQVGLTRLKSPDALDDFWWKSDERLIYRSVRHDAQNNYIPILVAVDRDGRRKILLNFNPQPNGSYNYDFVFDLQRETPGWALLVSEAQRSDYPTVYRTDVDRLTTTVETGSRVPGQGAVQWPTTRRPLFNPPGRKCDYETDNQGVVRTCLTRETDGSQRLLYRAGERGEWQELRRFAPEEGVLRPVGFLPDNRRMYVYSDLDRDTTALYEYDPERPALGELLFEAQGVDLARRLYAGNGRTLLAVTYYKQGLGVHYLDGEAQDAHLALIEAFPQQQSALVSFSADNRRAIAWVGNPSTPGAYYLFEPAKGTLSKVADIAPWIDPAKMARVRAITFPARDGLLVSAYLTVPVDRSERNLPLIVYVHGGPYGVRDYAQFDRVPQFFANRGYAVLQINFRGSAGSGWILTDTSAPQWGKHMQHDIVDGVRHLIEEGIVNRTRIGIYGGSYGGYAAMMTLITAPDLFKCVITFGGVSDLVSLLKERMVTTPTGLMRRVSVEEQRFRARFIGDPNDEAALREISPLHNADKVNGPTLIVHGADDLIVPLKHATGLKRALRRAGKPAELIVYREEGHGLMQERNRIDFFRRMEAFLATHLPVPPPGT